LPISTAMPRALFSFILSSLSFPFSYKHNSHFFCHIVHHKSMNFRWRSFIWKRKRKEFCGGKNVSMFILLVRIFLDILKLKIRIFSSFHDSLDSRQNKTFFLYPWKKYWKLFFFSKTPEQQFNLPLFIVMVNNNYYHKYRVFHAKWNITKRCISASRNAKADLRTILDSSLTAIFVRINHNFFKENFYLHILCIWTCQKWKKNIVFVYKILTHWYFFCCHF